MTELETAIRDFIITEVLYDKQLSELGPMDSLLTESELLDSIGIMQIVSFCEQAFDTNIPEEELLPDNFENVHVIAEMLTRVKAQGTSTKSQVLAKG